LREEDLTSLAIVGLLEEQQLERHPPDLPVGVQSFPDHEPAQASGVQRHDGDELDVNVLTVYVNAWAGALEPDQRGDSRAGGARRDTARDLESLLILVEFEAPTIVPAYQAVAALNICPDSRPELLEQGVGRTFRLSADPVEVGRGVL
jgi:hypothetical protein